MNLDILIFRRFKWALRIMTNQSIVTSIYIIYNFLIIFIKAHNYWFFYPFKKILEIRNIRSAFLSTEQDKNYYSSIPHSDDKNFEEWLLLNYPKSESRKIEIDFNQKTDVRPFVSIVMPLYKPSIKHLVVCLESVIGQYFRNWELCIYADGKPKRKVKLLIDTYCKLDPRIKFKIGKVRGHISSTTNLALKMAVAKYVALLDQDDFLPPHSIQKVVNYVLEYPKTDFLYTDEAKIDEEQKVSSPFFKPDWSPDYINSLMYVCHMLVFKKEFILQLGGLRVGFEGAQDWDLVLRASEKTNQIGHISDILYYWRIHPNSEAMEGSLAKSYAHKNARKALTESLERKNEPGIVRSAPRTGKDGFVIDYEVINPGKISILIPFKDKPELLDKCLESISKSDLNLEFEIVLIDNLSQEHETEKIIKKWNKFYLGKMILHRYHGDFNYSKIHNSIVPKTNGNYLLFLNNDTEIISRDWLNKLIQFAQKPRVGAVGGLLLYPDRSIQHAGVIMGLGGGAAHAYRQFKTNYIDYFYRSKVINNFSCVTAACMMCRKEVFFSVGGFNELFSHNYNDVDLCLKFIEKGLYNVYLPDLKVIHHESKTRGNDLSPSASKGAKDRFDYEYQLLRRLWRKYIDNDPFYNLNLTRKSCDFRINLCKI